MTRGLIAVALTAVACCCVSSSATAISAPRPTAHRQVAARTQAATAGSLDQLAQLVPSDTDESFASVITAGGYVFAAAPRTSGAGGINQGAIFVFAPPAGGWSGSLAQVAELTPGPDVTSDELAHSLAVSPDGRTVFAGTDSSSPQAVFVFTEPNGGWAGDLHQSAELVAAQPVAGDGLGVSLAVDGDTVVAGAPAAGGAYVFVEPATGWTGTVVDSAKLATTDPASIDGFNPEPGYTVAISGQTIVLGEAVLGGGPGVAYVYSEPADGWHDMTQSARLTASSGALLHEIPSTAGVDQVSVSGDTVAVPGSLAADSPTPSALFVYTMPAGGWSGTLTENAVLTSSSGGDVDDPIVAGDTIFATNSDATYAYAYDEPAGGWTGQQSQSATLTPADGGTLGPATLVGDQLLTGGGFDGTTATSLTRAYLFTEPSTGWSGTVQDTAELGEADQGGPASPAAYVFTRPPGGWVSEPADATLDPSGEISPVSLTSVSASGSTVVATPVIGPSSTPPAGSTDLSVFSETPAGWIDASSTTTLTASDGALLGAAVVAGQTIVAPGNGRVYVFRVPSRGTAAATHEVATLSDSQGAVLTSASVSGNVVAAGDDVFAEPTDGWAGSSTQSARLLASEGEGASVADAVSGRTIAVERGQSAGSATVVDVYVEPTGGWTGEVEPSATLRPRPGFSFRGQLALSGRVVAVTGGARATGAAAPVSVFVEPAAGWTGELLPTAVADGAYSQSFRRTARIAVEAGRVAIITNSRDHYGDAGASVLTIEDPPADGWGRSPAPAPVVTRLLDGDAVALGPGLAFVAGSAVDVLSVHGGVPPVSSALRASGLDHGVPRLSFRLYRGLSSPPLRTVTVRLPAGLRFARHLGAAHRGISVDLAPLRSVSISHGRLLLTLGGSPAHFSVKLTAPALSETRALEQRLRPTAGHRPGSAVPLSVRVAVVDAGGASTPLRAPATIPRQAH